MSNIHNMLTNVGHRFGHHSGLDKSSGQSSKFRLQGIMFRVSLMFCTGNRTLYVVKHLQLLLNTNNFGKTDVVSQGKKACGESQP